MIRAVSTLFRQQYRNKIYFNSISTTLQKMSVELTITENLTQEFKPTHLEVLNESYMHNVPKVNLEKRNIETKRLRVLFDLQRHRMVNEALRKELEGGVHALSIQAKTPEQWESSVYKVNKSPPCMGGSGR